MMGYVWFEEQDFAWRRHHGTLIPIAMPHVEPHIRKRDALLKMFKYGGLLIRWDEEFDSGSTGNWWHVIRTSPLPMEELSANTRSKIRRGMKRLDTVRLGAEEVAKRGYDAYRSAYERYTSFEKPMGQTAFRQAIRALPEFTEFIGVAEKSTGDLVGFSENVVRDDACFFNSLWFSPRGLRSYASYVLLYAMTNYYIADRGLAYVSDGARNISHETGIHEFLQEKFRFRKAYSNLRVIYAPGVGLTVRVLYPFRHLIDKPQTGFGKRLAVLLRQEEIRRSCLA